MRAPAAQVRDRKEHSCPSRRVRDAGHATRFGVIYYGSTAPAIDEALASLAGQGIHLDALRVRAFPFHDSIADFIAAHEQVFVVEQNRDAQLASLLVNELVVDPAKLMPGAALRRHADHRPFHRQRNRRKLAMFQRDAAAQKVAP